MSDSARTVGMCCSLSHTASKHRGRAQLMFVVFLFFLETEVLGIMLHSLLDFEVLSVYLCIQYVRYHPESFCYVGYHNFVFQAVEILTCSLKIKPRLKLSVLEQILNRDSKNIS